MPEISVIVVNWNGRQFLDDCLSSLRAQTFRDFETILVDNASSDGSVEYVRDRYPEVLLVASTSNLGFAEGNNAGLAVSSGRLIALLNNDAAAHPDWLSHLYRAAVEHPEAGSLATKMLRFHDHTLLDNCGFWVTGSCTTVEFGRDDRDGPAYSQPTWVFGACGGASAYRREALDEVGFFDPRFFMIYEDLDLSFRLQLAGYRCLFVPPAMVYHRLGATLGKIPTRQVFWSQRNIEYAFAKNMPASLMVRYALPRLVYEVGAALFFTFRGAGAAFWRAKWAALRSLPVLLRDRRQIKSRRKITVGKLNAILQRQRFRPTLRRFLSALRRSPLAPRTCAESATKSKYN